MPSIRRQPSTKRTAANTPQGGRFASASQNVSNKGNTARLQGEETFEVIDPAGNRVTYDTAGYQEYQRQQKIQQQQKATQQRIESQQASARKRRNEATPKQGRNISVSLNENLGFNDRINKSHGVLLKERLAISEGPPTTVRVQPEPKATIQKSQLKVNPIRYYEDDTRSIEEQIKNPVPANVGFGPYIRTDSDANTIMKNREDLTKYFNPFPKIPTKTKPDLMFDTRRRLEGVYEEAKNLVLEIAQGELKYGAGFARTTGGKIIPATKQAKEISKTVESNYNLNTFTQKLSEGRLGEIDLSEPKTQGQAGFFVGSLIGPPTASATKVKVGKIILSQAEKSAVKKTEKFLKEIGDSFGLEKLQATKTVKVKPSVRNRFENFFKSSKNEPKEEIFKEVPDKNSPAVYISSGGTQENPKPFYVLRGVGKKGFRNPTLEEIIPTQTDELQTLMPNKINIRGGLSAFEQQQLGLEAAKNTVGKRRFVFTTKQTPAAVEQQRFYKEGVLGKEIVEIGKGKEAPLENVLSGNLEKYVNPVLRTEQYSRPSNLETMYHGTDKESARSILESGLSEGSFLGSRETAFNFALRSDAPYAVKTRAAEIRFGKGKPASEKEIDNLLKQYGQEGELLKVELSKSDSGKEIFRITGKRDTWINPKYVKKSESMGSQYNPSVYSETKAEKPVESFINELGQKTTKPGKRPSTPFSFPKEKGTGSSSNQIMKNFEKSEQDFIKQAVTPKTTSKVQGPQNMGKYFSGTIYSQMESYYPNTKSKDASKLMMDDVFNNVSPKTKSESGGIIGVKDFMKTGVIPKSQQKGFLGLNDKLDFVLTPKLGVKPKLTPKQIIKQTPAQQSGFDYTPSTKTTPVLDTPVIPQQTTFFTPPSPPRTPPLENPRLFPFPPYVPGAYFGSGGFESPSSLKNAFAAYGISSDINIKTLPTYSRYGSSKGVFQAQAKEDKMIQNLFYGKPKSKKSGSKKKTKSKKTKSKKKK